MELPPPFVGQEVRPAEPVLPDLAFELPEGAGEGGAPPATLFVGNVDVSLPEVEGVLLELFTQMGHVLRVSVPRDKAAGKLRGFAFCDFADPRSARYAVAVLNGLRVGGRNIRLELKGGAAAAPPARPPPLPLPPAPGGGHLARAYEGAHNEDARVGRLRHRDEDDGAHELGQQRRRAHGPHDRSPPRRPYDSDGYGRRC